MQHLLRTLVLAGPLAAQTALPPPAKSKIDFIRDVEPILVQKCHSCHGDGVPQAGLNLKRRQNAMRGGDYGPVIVPGNSAASKLIKRLVTGDGGMQMPPTGALSDEEIGVLRAWIDQGADWRLEVKEDPQPKPLDPQSQALLTSVRTNDIPAVTRAIAANPQLAKLADNQGSTLLHHATAYASLDMMKLLIDKGADPNAQNRRKSTPMHWAIHDEAKVRLLRSHGAAIDAKQAEGRSPLYQAASLPNANAVIRFLLQEGADPNVKTLAGLTPLMMAATRGNVDGLRLLLAKKATVNAQAGNGVTALMNAASSGNANAVRLLLDHGANPNLKMKKGDTALMDAAISGVEESVRLLLDAGAEVNARGERGYTALLYAAASDAMTVGSVKRLLDKGADPDVAAEGETAKTLAAKRGDTESARLLGASEEQRKSGGVVAAKNQTPRPISLAVGKALALLEKQSHNFIRIGGCNSCHAQDLPSAAVAVARDRGLPAPQSIAQLSEAMRGASVTKVRYLSDRIDHFLGSLGMQRNACMERNNHSPIPSFVDAVAAFRTKQFEPGAGNLRHEPRSPSSGRSDAEKWTAHPQGASPGTIRRLPGCL